MHVSPHLYAAVFFVFVRKFEIQYTLKSQLSVSAILKDIFLRFCDNFIVIRLKIPYCVWDSRQNIRNEE